jgi:ABC-type amino acid transport substrate-binding protein
MRKLKLLVSTARLAAVATLAGAACTGWCGTTLDRIRQANSVTIGYRAASVPFSYTVGNGEPIGYSIDLCRRFVQAIGQATGMKKLAINYVPVTSSTRIPAVAQGKVDLECESTTNTPERRRVVAFSVPHYVTGVRYAVRADSDIAVLGDFRRRKLASTSDTSPLKKVQATNEQLKIGAEVLEVPEHSVGLDWVESRKVDGFAMDEVLLAGLIASRPDPSRLKIVGKYLTIEALGIMMSIDDAELRKIVNDEMRRLISSGEAAAMHDRWFVQPIPPKNQSLALRMPFLLRDYWRFPTERLPE